MNGHRYSLVVIIALYLLQLVTFYQIFNFNQSNLFYYLFLIWDVVYGLYLVSSFNFQNQIGAKKCAIQWLLYSFTIIVKMSLVSFVIGYSSNRMAQNDHHLIIFPVLLVPLIYTAFFIRSKSLMIDQLSTTSSLELYMLSDYGLVTTLDLIDLMSVLIISRDIFQKDLVNPDLTAKWLSLSMIISVFISMLILGCAYPSITKTKKSLIRSGELDIFFCSKNSFLLDIFFIDIAFASYRTYLLINYHYFDLFLLKNCAFLFLRPYWLSQCRLAQLENEKGIQFRIDKAELRANKAELIQKVKIKNSRYEDESAKRLSNDFNESHFSSEISPEKSYLTNSAVGSKSRNWLRTRTILGLNQKNTADSDENIADLDQISEDSTRIQANNEAPSTGLDVPAVKNDHILKKLLKTSGKMLINRRLKNLSDDLLHIRHLPTAGFRFLQFITTTSISFKNLLIIQHHQNKTLDSTGFLKSSKQLVILIPYVVIVLAKAAYLVYSIIKSQYSSIFGNINSPLEFWIALWEGDAWGLEVLLVSSVILLIFGFFSSSFIDSLFTSVGWGLQFLSYIIMVNKLIFLIELLPSDLLSTSMYFSLKFLAIYLLLLPVAFSSLLILILIFKVLLGNFHKCSCSKRNMGQSPQNSLTSSDKDPKNSNIGNLIIALICRNKVAPLSFSALLCGPDVIKDVKLCDNIIYSFWFDIFGVFIVRVLILLYRLNWYEMGIYILHLVYLALYSCICQSLILLSMRRYELSNLIGYKIKDFKKIDRKRASELYMDEAKYEEIFFHYKPECKFLSLNDKLQFYKSNGLFSSIGHIFPQII